MAVILQSPKTASNIYSIGGPWTPRPRNLFFISFQKALSTSTATPGTTPSSGTVTSGPIKEWQRSLPFLAKAVDRPSIQPQAEELNQYNKRRQVYTGYKVQPMKLVFYDTVDNLAHQMWDEYAKTFFGDFDHDNSRNDFSYDVTSPQFLDAGPGFGYAPKAAKGDANDVNAQFFFSSITVYQVFGNMFTQFDIINPKITSFDPDDLSYEESGVGLISLTLAYEAIIYKNNGVQLPLASDPKLYQAFVEKMRGGVPDFVAEQRLPMPTIAESASASIPAPAMQIAVGEPNPSMPTQSTSAGSLVAYGDFNFGNTIPDGEGRSLTMDLSARAASDPTLATILNIIPPPQPGDADSIAAGSPATGVKSLDPAVVDVARAAVATLGSAGGTIDMSHIGEAVVAAAMAAGIVNGDSPRAQVTNVHPNDVRGSNSWHQNQHTRGIALARQTYGILNAQRSPCSQIGFNTRRR